MPDLSALAQSVTVAIPEALAQDVSISGTTTTGTAAPEGVPPVTTPIPEQPIIPQEEEVKIDVENNVNTIQSNPQVETENLATLSTTLPQEPIMEKIQCDKCHKILNGQSELPQHIIDVHTPGQPCKFCENKEAYMKVVNEYLAEYTKSIESKKTVYLSIAELAYKMDIYRQRISEWEERKNDDGSLEHPEFSDAIKKLKTMQFFYLEKRLLGRYNPTGSIFLMKTQQDQIETEKKILAGSKETGEELRITITEEKPTILDE